MSIADLAPIPRKLTVAGRHFDLLPIRIRQITAFGRAIAPMMAVRAPKDWRPVDLVVALATQYPAELREAVAIGANVDPEWLDELFLPDFLRLAAAVFEVNVDFFARAVLPTVTELADRLTATAEAAGIRPATGAPPSPGSASVDTGSTKCSG